MSVHIMFACDTCGSTMASPEIPEERVQDAMSIVQEGVNCEFKCIWCRQREGQPFSQDDLAYYAENNRRARGSEPPASSGSGAN